MSLMSSHAGWLLGIRDPQAAMPRQTVFQIARLDTVSQAAAASAAPSPKKWWSQTGSNRRPHACKARALPTELWPQGVSASGRTSRVVVGLGRLERPTSPLSGVRSNHLSYRPRAIEARRPAVAETERRSRYLVRKRNEDGVRPAKWVLTEPCI